MTDECGSGSGRRPVSRRRFVASAGATGLAVALAGCPIAGRDTPHGATVTDRTPGAAPGTTRGTPDDSTVRWGFEPLTEAESDALEAALHEQGVPDDVDVAFEPGDADVEQRRADYDRSLSADARAPDLFLMAYEWVPEFARRGQVAEISSLLSDGTAAAVAEDSFDALAAPVLRDEAGDLFGLPVAADFGTMQYRRDLVEAAGYDPVENDWATEPMTWEEWSHVAADVADSADAEYGFTTQWDIYEGTACCTFNEVLSSWGGAYFGGRENLFGPVGERPVTVDSDPVVRSLNMMRTFVHGEGVAGMESYAGGFTPAAVLGWVGEGSRAPFVDGEAVFHRGWASSLAPADDDVAVMPIPYAVTESEAAFPGTGGTTSAVRGWYATVNPDTPNPDAVAQVLEAAAQPAFQSELGSVLGWLPPRPDLFAGEFRESLGAAADTFLLAGLNAMPRPVTSVWNDEASVIAQAANRVVGQEVTASKAMAELASDIEAIERTG